MWASFIGDWESRNPKTPPMTNADRIRAMSDEELAEVLCDADFCGCCEYERDNGTCHYIDLHPNGKLFDGGVEMAPATSAYNRCECIACPRRCVESFTITSNRTLTETDLEKLRRRNDHAADRCGQTCF